MPWKQRRHRQHQARRALTAAADIIQPRPLLEPARTTARSLVRTPDEWQREVWDFYDVLGEFRQGVTWKANMLSRVRLRAAKIVPIQDEPEIVDQGPAHEIIRELAGGVGGQAQLMSGFAVYLSVPGECWLVGETINGVNKWYTRSIEEIKSSATNPGLMSVQDGGRWRELSRESYVVRVYRSHKRWNNVADSPARAARALLRELELVNRHIQAQYMSRLASAGVLLMPEEMTFPVREEFQDAPDPFTAEFVEVAAEAIKTPGTAASIIPIPIRGPAEYIEKVRHVDFTLKLDDRIIQKRDSALARLAIELDMPAEALLGTKDVNHWCVDEKTTILTQRGWLTQADLQEDDVVLTLNHITGSAEWQPVQSVYRADVVDLPMIHMTSRNHDSLTTVDHRWPVIRNGERIIVRAYELQPRDQIVAAASVVAPSEVKHHDALVELVAWLWTEGHIRGRTCSIAQSHTRNPERVALIRQALTTLYGPAVPCVRALSYPAWREVVQLNHSSFGGPITIFHLNKEATDPLLAVGGKHPSVQWLTELTTAQLALFVDRSGQGDGQHYRRGLLDMWQANLDDLDAYDVALLLLGHQVCRTDHRVGVWSRPIQTPRRKLPVIENYTGTVWCPVTTNSTWLARRNGKTYFTGNSAWLVDEQGVKIHVAPDVETICDALTIGYLHPRLKGMGEDPSDWVVWYDASELILRPDRSESAKDAYDRFELTGEALRRELGFDESDKPSNEELREIILKKIAQQQMNAFAAMDELGYDTTHDEPKPVNTTRPNTPPLPDNGDPRGDRTPPQDKDREENPISRRSRLGEQLTRQAELNHAVRIDHLAGTWTLLHPRECNDHLYSCPITHATWRPIIAALPGTPGTYWCHMNAEGATVLGTQIINGDADDMIGTKPRPLPTAKL